MRMPALITMQPKFLRMGDDRMSVGPGRGNRFGVILEWPACLARETLRCSIRVFANQYRRWLLQVSCVMKITVATCGSALPTSRKKGAHAKASFGLMLSIPFGVLIFSFRCSSSILITGRPFRVHTAAQTPVFLCFLH